VNGMGTSSDPGRSGRLAVRGARILDVRRGAWDDRSTVLIDGGRVAELMKGPPPDGIAVVDVPGSSLIPGLVDAHTHVLLQDTLDRSSLVSQMVEQNLGHRIATAVRAMHIALEHGFTTIRDLGTEGAGYTDVGLRDAAVEGIVAGPRMLVAGPAIRPTGRYPLPGQPHSGTFPVGIDSCSGVDACRDVVRTQVAHGVDWIKIYVSGGPLRRTDSGYPDGPAVFTEAEVGALVDEAHRQGLRIAAHAQCLTGTRMAIEAGVDSIEHGYAITPELARAMADRGVTLVATLLVGRESAARGWYGDEWVESAHQRSFQNCLEVGVPIALGTDVGGFGWTDISQAEELSIMVGLGQTPIDALRSATLVGARLVCPHGTGGELACGAWGDVVAVDGDPLADVSAVRNVRMVVQNGAVRFRREQATSAIEWGG